MKSKVLMAFLFLPFIGFGQDEKKENFGVKVEGGMSSFHEVRDDRWLSEVKVVWAFSFNLGVFYQLNLSDKSMIEAEMKYSHLNNNLVLEEITAITDGNSGKAEEIIDIQFNQRFSYIAFPVYFGYKFGKFSPNLGVRLNLLLSDRSTTIIPAFGNYPEQVLNDEMGTDQVDFGPRIGGAFRLSRSFSLDITYYHGLINLINWETGGYTLEWYNRQLTLGVKYALFE